LDKVRDDNLSAEPSRRRFLTGLIAGLNGLLALAISIPGLGYLLTPILRSEEQTWVKVGSVRDVQSRGFSKATFTYVTAAGYVRTEKRAFVWIRQEDNGIFTAFSPQCTHMGCNVSWNVSRDRFECPCHGGKYDDRGNVVDGPPPRPLERYLTKVEHGTIYIKRNEA